MTIPPLSPEAVEAGELLAGLTPLEMDQYAGLTPLERVAAATHPHISMCRLGDTRMDCITCADELHRIRAYIAAVRQAIAQEITDFADVRRDAARQYAHELPMNARVINDCVTDAYYVAAAMARDGDPRNVHCANCGGTRGGPFGHETSECQWQRCNTAERPAPRHAAPDDGIGDDSAPVAAAPEGEVSGG